MKKHIYLSGFMGAGKSRIGKLLAKEFQLPFVDTDKKIEAESGRMVKDIFDQSGEAVFRQMETDMISRLARDIHPAVISLGGGAQKNPENRKIIESSGLLVYIKSSPEAIHQRVKHSNKRPLLVVENGDDFEDRLMEKIKTLLAERSAVYEEADIIFERDGLEVEDIVPVLIGEINRYWKNYGNH